MRRHRRTHGRVAGIGIAALVACIGCSGLAEAPVALTETTTAAGPARIERVPRPLSPSRRADCAALAPTPEELSSAMTMLEIRYFQDGRRTLPGVGLRREIDEPGRRSYSAGSNWVPRVEPSEVPDRQSAPLPLLSAAGIAELAPALSAAAAELDARSELRLSIGPAKDPRTALRVGCATRGGAALVWRLERFAGEVPRDRSTGAPIQSYDHDGRSYEWMVLYPREGAGDYATARTPLSR